MCIRQLCERDRLKPSVPYKVPTILLPIMLNLDTQIMHIKAMTNRINFPF